MDKSLITFIIPAYNEEGNLCITIPKLRKHIPLHLDYEIILVDHGSTDHTVELAKQNGARVFVHPVGTIAGLRNYGASKARGDILIFLDADVLLTKEWERHINVVISMLRNGRRMLTGSWYSVPEQGNLLERFWYKPLQKGGNTHINSGHMIISTHHFNELNGFLAELETGEDYDISMRAKVAGLQVVDDPKLIVIHEGYPKNLWEFVRREFWHGKGDASTLKAILKSKVAIVASTFFALHLALLGSYFYTAGEEMGFTLCFMLLFIIFGASYMKYKDEPIGVIGFNALIYYCYFWARAASIISRIFGTNIKKRHR